jgi:hypothetical protein
MTQAQREVYIQETMNMPYRQALCVAASVYLVIACVTLAIAACLFVLILRLCGRREHFRSIFCRKSRVEGEKRERLVTPILILSIVLCLAYMTADVIMG